MPVAFSFALIALAQAASATPPTSTPAPSATATKATSVPAPDRPDGCEPQPRGDSRTIVVCAPKPQGYRIDPDVLEARREARNHTQPKPPETMKYNNCATVGPMGCRGNVGIDLANAAAVLGEMVARASQGGNVGQMFVTEPQQSEYQLYVEAKKRREAEEAKAAAAKAKAAALAPRAGAAAAAKPAQTRPAAPAPPQAVPAQPAPQTLAPQTGAQ
jgi:hypothetical protein